MYCLLCFYCRAQSFAERLRLGLAVIHGDQWEPDSEIVDGRHSPPPERSRRISAMYSEVASELIPPGNSIVIHQCVKLILSKLSRYLNLLFVKKEVNCACF